MLRHTQSGFINAVEVADFLAQTKSLPFRTAHRIVAKAVKRSEASGSRLQLSILNQILKSERRSARAMKKHLGAPGPSAVRAHLEGLKRQRTKNRNWRIVKLPNLNTAKKKLAREQRRDRV
jgi:argininosuccinate lyase